MKNTKKKENTYCNMCDNTSVYKVKIPGNNNNSNITSYSNT